MGAVSFGELLSTVDASRSFYHKLILFAGLPGSGKTRWLNQIADELQLPVINLSLKVSENLLSLTRRQRQLKAEEIARDAIDEGHGRSVCLDNTEMLFDSSLRLNPLVFLQDSSRNRLIIATWNGSYDGKNLSFGYSGHPDFFQQAAGEYAVFAISNNEVSRF